MPSPVLQSLKECEAALSYLLDVTATGPYPALDLGKDELNDLEQRRARARVAIKANEGAPDPDILFLRSVGLLTALLGADEALSHYEDADHNGHTFTPNTAMRARQEISKAIAEATAV